MPQVIPHTQIKCVYQIIYCTAEHLVNTALDIKDVGTFQKKEKLLSCFHPISKTKHKDCFMKKVEHDHHLSDLPPHFYLG